MKARILTETVLQSTSHRAIREYQVRFSSVMPDVPAKTGG